MRISYNWLKERLPLTVPAQELCAHLLNLGFEVSSLEKRGPAFTGVVTAQVVSREKHPNADKLSVCVVDDGTKKWTVVCGAPNVAAGQKVALARVGAALPGGMKIGQAKLRGVESNGMICSGKELGLGQDGAGILVLPPETALGLDFAGTLGPCDDILEVEITPNRPDCLSHLGLARELAAYFRMPLKPTPAASPVAAGAAAGMKLDVRAPQACPRYMGLMIEGLTIGPSPAWLKQRLESVGLRPINAVVDVTNFLLMDMGQPLHAFDADTLDGGTVIVRWAAAGETLKALDGATYSLNENCLVIADSRKAVAIAGVMGGLETAVTEKTKRVFLESAHFFPPAVRKASQSLRLRSDSSYRFERGTDIAAVEEASRRAAELILSLCGGKASKPVESYPEKRQASAIPVSVERINGILGSDFSAESVEGCLRAIAAFLTKEGESLRFTPPSYRGDLATAWDLAEETGRLLGYDNVPSRLPAAPMKPSRSLPLQTAVQRCVERLAGLGLHEAYNYDLLAEKTLTRCRIPLDGAARVSNPLSQDWTILRPSLLPGLLANALTNVNHGAEQVRLFEVGKTYVRAGDRLEETLHISGVLFGEAAAPHWRGGGRSTDFYDAKGLVADLARGLAGLEWLPLDAPASSKTDSDPLFHPKASLRLKLPRGVFGTVGALHPTVARAWGLDKEEPVLFDLRLELLADAEAAQALFKPFSAFPGSKRDLSFLLPVTVPYAAVESSIRSCAIAELQGAELIDVFKGEGVPAGRQSLTVRLQFGRDDRTLKDSEVTAALERLLQELSSRHDAVLRS
jgi:phenylalanyl-tRNA synthetase beta chain